MKSFRQKHLAACYGKDNYGFRRVAFVQEGVSVVEWSMCEWCATHGCGEGLKLELVIRDDVYTCDCTKEHERVAKAKVEEAEAQVYEAKYGLYKPLYAPEPISQKDKETLQAIKLVLLADHAHCEDCCPLKASPGFPDTKPLESPESSSSEDSDSSSDADPSRMSQGIRDIMLPKVE